MLSDAQDPLLDASFAPHSGMCGWRIRAAACLTTVQVAGTKIFLAGMGWQAAAFASRQHSTSLAFSFAAGVGDAAGTFVGNAILLLCLSHSNGWPGCSHVMLSGMVVSAGSLVSGAMWQQLVDYFQASGLSFTPGMVLVGLVCGAGFYSGITIAALCVTRCRRTRLDFAKDFTLAVSVGGATAAFVGTDESWHGNWLQQVVGERDGSSVVLDCLKAGASVVLGFCILQLVLIAIVPSRVLWTTPDSHGRAYQSYDHPPAVEVAGNESRS